MRRRAVCPILVSALLASALVASPAFAQPTKPSKPPPGGDRNQPAPAPTPPTDGPSPEARAANQRAVEFSEQGKYAEALEQFQLAYDLSPSYVILFNIGKTSRLTQDFARSLEAYQRYLMDGGADIDAPTRTAVEKEIAELTALVGWVSITGEADAEITIDGKSKGKLPIDRKLPVNPGPRSFSAKKGLQHQEQDITAKATETITVDLSFKPDIVTTPKHPFRFPNAAVVSAWVATGLFTATAIATGTVAIVTSNDLEDDIYVGPGHVPPQDSPLTSKSNRIDALASATDAFIVLGAVSGAAAISFTIVNAVAGPETPADGKDAPKASVEVHAGIGSISVSGSF